MVETSPDGRFRFVKEGGGAGAAGTAYDTENGLLVDWNELNLRGMSSAECSSARRSIDLLKSLNHSHVLGVYTSWDAPSLYDVDSSEAERPRHFCWKGGEQRQEHVPTRAAAAAAEGEGEGEGGRVVFLTTPCITLEAFLETKVEFLRWRVVKRWCRQILEALVFLHGQSPPVVHKDLSLSSIYIEPSKSHLLVGGVEDIVAPLPPRRTTTPVEKSASATTTANTRGSWGDRAWGLVAGVTGGGFREGAAEACEDAGLRDDDSEDEDDGGAAGEAGVGDVRAFGTVLVEMILKKRLDPSLARDERFLEMLPALSGWPSSVVDFLRLCRASVGERPSAFQLLDHPFLELGNDLDDEAIYGDEDLVWTAAVAAAAAAAATVGGDSATANYPIVLPEIAAVAGAAPETAAAAAAASSRAHTDVRRALPPPPLFAPRTVRNGPVACSPSMAAGFNASPSSHHTFVAKMQLHDQSCPGCHGASGWSTCAWSPEYTPSCVSTESPSPSSPSAAPCFGGVPTTPCPLPAATAAAAAAAAAAARGFTYDGGAGSATVAAQGLDTDDDALAAVATAAAAAAARGVSGDPFWLPPGFTAAALANASLVASKMSIVKASSVDGRGTYGGRQRAVSYSDRQQAMAATAAYWGQPIDGSTYGGGGGGGGGGGNGADFSLNRDRVGDSGPRTTSATGRSRSASEDAVWDMLPSDESQCRRPFSGSAMEGLQG